MRYHPLSFLLLWVLGKQRSLHSYFQILKRWITPQVTETSSNPLWTIFSLSDTMPITVVLFCCMNKIQTEQNKCMEIQFVCNVDKSLNMSSLLSCVCVGEHLRICPQGYTCCTSAMEETLSNLSRREFEGLVREAGRSLQASLNAQYRSFDSEQQPPRMHTLLYTDNTNTHAHTHVFACDL